VARAQGLCARVDDKGKGSHMPAGVSLHLAPHVCAMVSRVSLAKVCASGIHEYTVLARPRMRDLGLCGVK